MVIPAIHFYFEVVANLVYQFNLKERLTTDKIPYDALLAEILFAVKDIVYSCLRYFPCHPFLGVFPNQVTVLASQLAILRDNERDALCHSVAPTIVEAFYLFHCIAILRMSNTLARAVAVGTTGLGTRCRALSETRARTSGLAA